MNGCLTGSPVRPAFDGTVFEAMLRASRPLRNVVSSALLRGDQSASLLTGPMKRCQLLNRNYNHIGRSFSCCDFVSESRSKPCSNVSIGQVTASEGEVEGGEVDTKV